MVNNVEDIFKESPKDPFHYDLKFSNLNQNSKPEEIFENIKNIFIKGLLILNNNEEDKKIKIENINKINFELVRKHMLSIGIETKYKVYKLEDIDYHIRELLYDLEKIKELDIHVNLNWKTQIIDKFSYTFNNANIKTINKFYEYVNKHKETAWLLNLKVNIKELKDIAIKFTKKEEPNIVHILYFDYAKLIDYPYLNKFKTEETKHVK